MALTRWAVVMLTLLALAASSRVAFDDDEFQHARMSKLIGNGEVPHRDFYEHHLPLYHLLHAGHMRNARGPGPLLRLRAFSVLAFLLSLEFGSRVLKIRTGSAPPPVLLWLGLSPIVFLKMVEARPEPLALMLGMLALLLLSGERSRSGWAGVATACMVLASQKFLFLGVGLFAVCWLERGWRDSVRFTLAGMVPGLLTLLGLVLTHSLAPAWEHLVVMNAAWKESFSPAIYGGLLWRTSGIPLVTALFGLMIPGERKTRLVAACLLAGGLLGIFMVPIPYRQTFLMLVPGWLLAAALGWSALRELLPKGRIRTLGCTLLFTAGLLPALANLNKELESTLDADVENMRAVAEATSGPVFDARGLLYGRPHVGFYPWLHAGLMQMLDPETYTADTLEALKQNGYPPYLEDYRSREFPEALRTFLGEYYLPTEIPGLHRYGFRLDRSRLMGSGTERALPVAGRWRVNAQGGPLILNGTPVKPGETVELPAGVCRIQARGFVRNATLMLMEASP